MFCQNSENSRSFLSFSFISLLLYQKNILFLRRNLKKTVNTMKKVISIDWLSFSYNLSLTDEEYFDFIKMKIPAGYSAEYFDGTKVFNRRLILRDASGRKVLTLLYDPKSSLIPKRICLCEVANVCLYDGSWRAVCLLVQKMHAGNFNSLSRLDIACDFDEIGDDVANMFDGNHIYVQRKKEGCMFYDHSERDGYVIRKPRQISFGSKTSKIKWKLYNKSKEIKVSHKEYIEHMWHEEGMDLSKDIWRLEVSLTRVSSLQCLNKENADLLDFREFWERESYIWLFPALYTNNFVVRRNLGRADNKYKPNPLFDFLEMYDEKCVVDLSVKSAVLPARKYVADKEVVEVFLRMVTDLQKEVVRRHFSVADNMLSAVRNMMNVFCLEDVLKDVCGVSFEELVALVDAANR